MAIERRRRLACSGPMPPALASRFTTGQLAVLRIVGDEMARNGACGLCIDAIAARAGVCRRLAQGAMIDCRPLRAADGCVENFVAFEREVIRRIGRPAIISAGHYEQTDISNHLLTGTLRALAVLEHA
ncbi:hypothetical protein MKK75_06915 [Methylobacterium sp. J-030]|uniref:hypothetical protein n=1 Tax=Methylobacterium sp. J-030 TaxID=2836627 RepID=UPI001FB93BA3|nr:hypothetical protein [Methylobacterium sp. J-030]MCJ2068537.1 hypothetical protein [Methylobacterium sp. J-030]